MTPRINALVGILHQTDDQIRRLEAERDALDTEYRKLAPPKLELTNLTRLLGQAQVAKLGGNAEASPELSVDPEVIQGRIDQARADHASTRLAVEQRQAEIRARQEDLPALLESARAGKAEIMKGFHAAICEHLLPQRDAALRRYAAKRGAVVDSYAELMTLNTLLSGFGASVSGGMQPLVLPGVEAVPAVHIDHLSEQVTTATNAIRTACYERKTA